MTGFRDAEEYTPTELTEAKIFGWCGVRPHEPYRLRSMTTRFLLASNPETLTAALAAHTRTVSIEAEYGDRLVEGSLASLAHHGPRAGQPAPCSYANGFVTGVEAVGLSHVDLDSLGGCLAVLGIRPDAPDFWRVAEFVDLNGIHRVAQANPTPETMAQLNAWYAWSEENRCYPARDGSATDVTPWVTSAAEALTAILEGVSSPMGAALLERGNAFTTRERELNEASFVELTAAGVLVRVSPSFVNHLYVTPQGGLARMVVAFGTRTGSVTVSFADPPTGRTARDLVQELWGSEAGGHAGIAGSPRDRRMTLTEFHAAVTLANAISVP
jgi:hypothetical protein